MPGDTSRGREGGFLGELGGEEDGEPRRSWVRLRGVWWFQEFGLGYRAQKGDCRVGVSVFGLDGGFVRVG